MFDFWKSEIKKKLEIDFGLNTWNLEFENKVENL
jgi:hypothetical protein